MTEPIDYKRFAILFVDDEEKILKYFSRAYSKHFRIITATSMMAGRNILDQQHTEIAVLVSDQRMPAEKGVQLLTYAREYYPDIIRILTTAYSDIDAAIDAVNKGEIFRYIGKPWNHEELYKELFSAMHLFLARQHERDLISRKRQAMFELAGSIAHEMRTPLLSIHSAANGINNYLPQLIEVYEQAKKKGEQVPPIRRIHRDTLKTALENISNETQHALTTIDILLTNVNDKAVQLDVGIHSMRECINEAVDRYPFLSNQQQMINLEGNDNFMFRGSRILLVHVYFNLIKNALYALATNSNKGNISLYLEPGELTNRVRFKDTGPGIKPDVLPYIFKDFYSTKSSNTGNNIGIGLPFCQRVLKQIKGNIDCQSELGVYTEFTLTFPPVPDST